MGGVEILLVLVIVGAGLYAAGVFPSPGVMRLYYRLRLVGLIWAAMVIIFAVNRTFDIV